MKNRGDILTTDDLIDALATAQRRQPRRPPILPLAGAGLVGLCVALAATVATIGLRPHLDETFGHPILWAKLGLTALIVVAAGLGARRLSLPGRTWLGPCTVLAATLVLIILWAIIDLALMPASEWAPCIEGRDWITCLIAIPLLALAPMLAMAVAMRRLAPTRLRAAGTLLGLSAGAIGAMAFTLYCRDDAVPFLVLWYGAALAISAIVGRILGPRLLRW